MTIFAQDTVSQFWSLERPVSDKTIMVVDRSARSAEKVRELIEFMDTPSVLAAAPSDWQECLGSRRLEALFVGPGLTELQIEGLLDELGAVDPNVPVVMMQQAQS